LPLHLQSKFSDEIMRGVHKTLRSMGIALVLDKQDLVAETRVERDIAGNVQTLIAWSYAVAPYKGKWGDMHRLANLWTVSDASDVRTFQTTVKRMCKKATYHGRFDRAWTALLKKS